MDNNNFNNQPNDNMQNMQNPQDQMGPMNQPMQQGMGPNMNPNMAPYPQPMMKPPKQPMDPAKKKKIIIIVSIISALLVVGIALAIILPIVLRVDYAETYKIASELRTQIHDAHVDDDCEDVKYYVDSSWVSDKDYAEYISGCEGAYDSGLNDLVTKLENSSGVKRDEKIKTQFDKFKTEYNKLSTGNADELKIKLSIWKAWHSFNYAIDDFYYGNYDLTDDEINNAANYLINSGNDQLKTYGEGWKEKALAVAAAFRAYDKTSYSDPNHSEIFNNYYDKDDEYDDWRYDNEIDIDDVAPLNFDSTLKMYEEYENLYTIIADTYEENYNYGSGDCTEIEFLHQVYCN